MPIPNNFPQGGGIPSRKPESNSRKENEELDFLNELSQDDEFVLPKIDDELISEYSDDEIVNENQTNNFDTFDDSLTFTAINEDEDDNVEFDSSESLSTPNVTPSLDLVVTPKSSRRIIKKDENENNLNSRKNIYSDDSNSSNGSSSVKRNSELNDVDDYSDSEVAEDDDKNIEKIDKKSRLGRKSLKSSSDSDDRSKKKPRPTRAKKNSSGEDEFIDSKNKKIIPFGGSKKSSIKDSDVDPRADRRKKANIVQGSVISLLALGALAGWYNALVPDDTMGEEEISQIAQTAIGATDFPMQSGEAFAKDFMQAYLSTSDDTAAAVLSYFYSGDFDGTVDATNRTVSRGYAQNVLYGPTVYESTPLTDYSANYVIGALVESSVVEDPAQVVVDPNAPDAVPVESAGGEPRWMFFSINIFYNANANRFYVTPDSPAVIPSSEVGRSNDVPIASMPGTGQPDDVLSDEIRSVVYGFLDGYSKSSSSDYTALEQYVAGDDVTIFNGLNNEYVFASGTVENSVDYSAFPVEGNPNEIKALIDVSWSTPIGDPSSDIRTTYESQYVMTLTKDGTKWLVSKFQPYLYVAGDPVDVQEMGQ